ncbi:MAG: radical SAM protein [Ignavibacteria bacterium]|nr:radical SAM protein [Ignavibacteria bacterium]
MISQIPKIDVNVNPLRESFNVSEIFYSIQGEGSRAGLPCTFVRLQGCKLRCTWCDTPYALDHRKQEMIMSGQQILDRIKEIGCHFIEFTGGEPLEQTASIPLMKLLCDEGYVVAVETGGHVDISHVDERVIRILDVKCPDSKMDSLNFLPNLDVISQRDEVKFVIASKADYDWAVDMMNTYKLTSKAGVVLFSAAYPTLAHVELVQWMLADKLPVRFQLQMHKYIWDPATRGV